MARNNSLPFFFYKPLDEYAFVRHTILFWFCVGITFCSALMTFANVAPEFKSSSTIRNFPFAYLVKSSWFLLKFLSATTYILVRYGLIYFESLVILNGLLNLSLWPLPDSSWFPYCTTRLYICMITCSKYFLPNLSLILFLNSFIKYRSLLYRYLSLLKNTSVRYLETLLIFSFFWFCINFTMILYDCFRTNLVRISILTFCLEYLSALINDSSR